MTLGMFNFKMWNGLSNILKTTEEAGGDDESWIPTIWVQYSGLGGSNQIKTTLNNDNSIEKIEKGSEKQYNFESSIFVLYLLLLICHNNMPQALLMRCFIHCSIVLSGGGSTTVAPVHDGYVLQKVFLINDSNTIHLLSCNWIDPYFDWNFNIYFIQFLMSH